MEQLLHLLKTIPEYRTLTDSLAEGKNAAVTGIGQINRSHLIAGLTRDCKCLWSLSVRMIWPPAVFRKN